MSPQIELLESIESAFEAERLACLASAIIGPYFNEMHALAISHESMVRRIRSMIDAHPESQFKKLEEEASASIDSFPKKFYIDQNEQKWLIQPKLVIATKNGYELCMNPSYEAAKSEENGS